MTIFAFAMVGKVSRHMASEVHATVYRQATCARRVELVVADVGESEVVGDVGIEDVVAQAASHAQAAVKTLEEMFRERLLCHAVAIVLYLAAYAVGYVSANGCMENLPCMTWAYFTTIGICR